MIGYDYDRRTAVPLAPAAAVNERFAMTSGLPMDVQLDVDEAAGPFADVTYRWIDEGSAALRPRFRAILNSTGPDGARSSRARHSAFSP